VRRRARDELRGEPTAAQQWEIVRFMAGVLEVAEE
jgi:hypothetical protein